MKKDVLKTNLLKSIKSISDSQVNKVIDGRCFIWCYEPVMPNKIKQMKKERYNK